MFVGDEKFTGRLDADPDREQYGGIRVFETSDLDDVEQAGYTSPPDEDVGLGTAHNFDVTNNRLHASWYNAGVRVDDITDPSDPQELAADMPECYAFWAAEAGRGFTVAGIYGSRSADHEGGVAVLDDDRGRRTSPGFQGSGAPAEPEGQPDDRGKVPRARGYPSRNTWDRAQNK